MKIEELWPQLEAVRVTAGSQRGDSGWVLRQLRPEAACPLHAAVELSTGQRGLLLCIAPELVPPKRRWPRCRGLEVLAAREGAQVLFGVTLKEARHADVFTALAEDLARRIIDSPGLPAKVVALIGGLARWQKFLSASVEGLSEEAQRGLWGELYFLRENLLPVLGPGAVNGWKGGERAHQDFQFERGAIEVKTTLAKQPQVVRITSERQLDNSAWAVLFLHVIALDMRDGSGETLPALVASLRDGLATDAAAREKFEDELLISGYLDVHAGRYAERGYIVRTLSLFRVGTKFPCFVEKNLPPGVGDISYGLSVSACESFRAKPEDVTIALIDNEQRNPRRRSRV